MTVTVGGLPGTGTTTLCRLLERALQLPYIYAGQLFREEAARRGMTLTEYNALAGTDETVDRELDLKQVEFLRGGGVILEGRLAGWLAHRYAIPAFKTWIVCEEQERVRRLVERDGEDEAAQRASMLDRVTRESDRYKRYYDADLTDLSIYDLVIDSTGVAPDALRDAVLAGLEAV